MKVTITIDGVDHRGVAPHEGADHVVVATRCPTCGELHAVVEGGRIVALGTPAKLATAHPKAELLPPPDDLQVRLVSYVEGYDRYTGSALCLRCQRVIGPMVVIVSTLFGIEEDRQVLQGRCRVY